MVGAPSFRPARFPLRRVGECSLDAFGRQCPAAIVHSRVKHWVRPRDKRRCLSRWVEVADTRRATRVAREGQIRRYWQQVNVGLESPLPGRAVEQALRSGAKQKYLSQNISRCKAHKLSPTMCGRRRRHKQSRRRMKNVQSRRSHGSAVKNVQSRRSHGSAVNDVASDGPATDQDRA
jgi:hypothetical protein